MNDAGGPISIVNTFGGSGVYMMNSAFRSMEVPGMKRSLFTAVTIVALVVPRAATGTDPFEQKLSRDQEIAAKVARASACEGF